MLANERDELVGCNQKCNCVHNSKQSQNDKARQPIGISQREETLKQGANGDLLSRLTADFVATSIDQAELHARMAEIQRRFGSDVLSETLEQVRKRWKQNHAE